jgi:type I restriction enzyme S subunit
MEVNTIPTGYKQTELGVIPEDWEVYSLKSLIKETPKYGISAAAVNFDLNLPTYLRITDIDESGNIIKGGLKSVDNFNAINYYLSEGDLVFARTGASVGKSYLYSKIDGEFVFAGFLIKISPDLQKLIPSYFSSVIKTKRYYDWVVVNSMRSGQPGINSRELGELLVQLPPTLQEQQAIATALSDVDALISSLETLIAKKKAIKEGAMQRLLTPPHKGGQRLPGFDGEWEEKRLKEVANYRRGSFPQPYGLSKWYDEQNGMPFVQVVDVGKQRRLNKETKQIIK